MSAKVERDLSPSSSAMADRQGTFKTRPEVAFRRKAGFPKPWKKQVEKFQASVFVKATP